MNELDFMQKIFLYIFDFNFVGKNYVIVNVDILNKLTPYGLFKLTPIDNL